MTPPETIFYAKTGGKTGPFYRTLGGVKSALKTSWGSHTGWRYTNGPPKVFHGTITWTEIDPETGLPLYRTPDVAVPQHVRVFHQGLITGRDPVEVHNLHHQQDLDHVHGEV